MGARPSEDTRRSDARSGIDSIRSCSECAASFCDPRQSRQKAHAKHCYEKLCKILSKGGANFNALGSGRTREPGVPAKPARRVHTLLYIRYIINILYRMS